MEVIAKDSLAPFVAARWAEQYRGHKGDDKAVITERLKALGDKATVGEVNAVIGNNSWTELSCDQCGRDDVEAVVRLGEIPDYDSRTFFICFDCLQAAVKLLIAK